MAGQEFSLVFFLCVCVLFLNGFSHTDLFLATLGLCCCAQAFANCSQQGLLSSCSVWAPHCGDFSFGAQALAVRASGAETPGLSHASACGIFSDQGQKVFHALAGGFLTTGPLGKSLWGSFNLLIFLFFIGSYFPTLLHICNLLLDIRPDEFQFFVC